MRKKSEKTTKETKLDEDLEAFEELKEEEELLEEGNDEALEEDLKEFEEMEMEKPSPESEKTELKVRAEEEGERSARPSNSLTEDLMELSPDVPVNLVAVIGKTTINVGELVKYRVGQVVDLNRTPGETVDVVANGRLIAKGELVEMDGKLGVKILKMVR